MKCCTAAAAEMAFSRATSEIIRNEQQQSCHYIYLETFFLPFEPTDCTMLCPTTIKFNGKKSYLKSYIINVFINPSGNPRAAGQSNEDEMSLCKMC
jgi:hypothetical protein